MYRASATKWLHPKAATPPGSALREDLAGAMHTPLAPDGEGERSVAFVVPGNLLPLFIGCSVYVGGPEPHFRDLKRGSHCTVPMGMGAGSGAVLGARIVEGGKAEGSKGAISANFAVVARHASAMHLRVLRLDDNYNVVRSMELALDPQTNRTGDAWHVSLRNLRDPEHMAYAWVAKGHEGWQERSRFAPGQLLLDPYADAAVHVRLGPDDGGAMVWAGSLAAQASPFNWGGSKRLRTALEHTFMLEVDVATFSATDTAPEHHGKFLGVLDKLEVLRSAGVTAVVLSCPMLRGPGLGVHGEAHCSFFAPDPRFAVGRGAAAASLELKQLIRGLHAAGIEVLLQAEYCFTTEGDDSSPLVTSMRGIDAGIYYRPGGLLNLAHPVVRRLVIDSLCHWASQYQVDGFVLLSAEALVQDSHGNVLDCPPIVQDITNHPVLSSCKIVTYPRSNNLLPREGRRGFPHAGRLLQHSNMFGKDMLRWLEFGEPCMISAAATRLTGSAEVFDAARSEEALPGNLTAGRRPAMAVNSALSPIVDGTTLEACCRRLMGGPPGGPPGDWRRLARTVVLVTALAQGTPMLSSAELADEELHAAVRQAWRLRQRLSSVMQPLLFDSPRDVSWLGPSGAPPAWDTPAGPDDAFLAIVVKGCRSSNHLDAVYFGVNPTAAALMVSLPEPPLGCAWRVLVDSAQPCSREDEPRGPTLIAQNYLLKSKAALLLEAVHVGM